MRMLSAIILLAAAIGGAFSCAAQAPSISINEVAKHDTVKVISGRDTSVAAVIDKDSILNVLSDKDGLYVIKVQKKIFKVITVKTEKDESNKFMQFLSNFQLRKSFQAIKDKEEAATVNLIFPKEKDNSQNAAIALGYNIEFGSHIIKPFVEWQRNTISDKKQYAWFIGITHQVFYRDLLSNKLWTPVFITTVNYKSDRVKLTEGTQASLYFAPSFNSKGFRPLPDAYNDLSVIGFRYNIYVGWEYENRSKVIIAEQKGIVGRYFGRITASFFPLPKIFKDKQLEIAPDLQFRYAFYNKSSAETNRNIYRKISFNATILKGKSGVSELKIGYDFIRGSDPTAGFDSQEINTLSLKFKI